jgi:glycosyltransferase involved in cell wall biosynthesis/GT2 family glycosyltransferase
MCDILIGLWLIGGRRVTAAVAVDSPKPSRPRVLRVAHHGVVSAWRQRERELIALGADITLVSSRTWNEGGRDIDFDPESDRFAVAARTVGRHPSVFAYAPRPLWRLLSQHWDLIDLHEEPNALATAEILIMRRLKGLNTPFVLYSAQNIEKRYPIPFRWIERYALRHASGVYVCNVEAGRILHSKGLSAPARLIGLGLDLEQFSPANRNSPTKPLHVGYVGRLDAYKGVSTLLDAAAEAPDWTVTIVGGGPQTDYLVRQCEQLGISNRVQFKGHLGADLPALYRELDVVVIPSLPTRSWLEQFCRVAIEAMASGVPVVGSRSGAIPDVVADAGILFEPGNAAEIRDAVVAATEPSRWHELRAAGLRRAQQYGWVKIARQHRDDEILADPTPRELESLEPPEVIVVAYGSPEPLAQALTSLEGCFGVTIVDNSSSSETAELARRFGARYIDPQANLGFASGVNLALRLIKERGLGASDVLLLNPDATISADGVLALQKKLHATARLACVAPAQMNPLTGAAERVVWPFPSPAAAWLTAIGAGRTDRRHGFVIGSILLIRSSALDEVGEFDERFFLYAEEADWQRRAVTHGWTIGYVPEVMGTHVGAGTGGSVERRFWLFNTSLLAYIEKHYGRRGRDAFRLAMMIGGLGRAILATGEARRAAARRVRFYFKSGKMKLS